MDMIETNRLREVFTIENFKAWVATKDPNEKFDYHNNKACGSAQFIQANGFPHGRAGGAYVRTGEDGSTDDEYHVAYPEALIAAYATVPRTDGKWVTFGDLLKAL